MLHILGLQLILLLSKPQKILFLSYAVHLLLEARFCSFELQKHVSAGLDEADRILTLPLERERPVKKPSEFSIII